MVSIQELPTQTLTNTGGSTGDNLKLSEISPTNGGMANYVKRIVVRCLTSFVLGGAGTVNFSRLFSNILLEIPGLGVPLVNAKSNDIATLFRLEHAGEDGPVRTVSTTGTWTAGATWGAGFICTMAGTGVLDSAFVIDFERPFAHDPTDGAIPAQLLRNAKFKLTGEGTIGNVISANGTSFSNEIHVEVHTEARDELVIPTLSTIDGVDTTGTQPVVDPIPGRYLAAGIREQTGVLTASDYVTLGFRLGDQRFSEDTQSVVAFYNAFNAYSSSDMPIHTVAGDFVSCIPLIYPENIVQGQHLSYGTAQGNANHRIKADVAAAGKRLVRRYAWEMAGVRPSVRAIMGLPPDIKARIRGATGKSVKNAAVKSSGPAKVITG